MEPKFNPDTRQAAQERLEEKKRSRDSVARGESERGRWTIYDESLSGFGRDFFQLSRKTRLFRGELRTSSFIQRYIESTLDPDGARKGTLVGVEFGGPGSQLFRGFAQNFFQETFGICLNDERGENLKELDEKFHHRVIAGDIWDSKLYRELTQKLEGKKVYLIISRIMGPLAEMNTNPYLWSWIGEKWYELLNTNGLLLAQYVKPGSGYTSRNQQDMRDRKIKAFIEPWIEMLQTEYPALEAMRNGTAFRLHKTEAAPEKLPLLSGV